jgi:hypothetical protein
VHAAASGLIARASMQIGVGCVMDRFRALLCGAALVASLAPLAAYADNSKSHAQDEVINGQAQLADAQQQVADMQAQAQESAANSRMIALLHSEALRQTQLNNVANGNAMEQIASALADATRAQGDVNAQNELEIAQQRAAALLANVDANLANAQMLAQTKGRWDELANAQAQSALLHQVADYILNTQAQLNMANDREIAAERADAIDAPAVDEQQNIDAMGADELLAADADLAAGDLDATSIEITAGTAETDVLSHAWSSLANDEAMEAEATAP